MRKSSSHLMRSSYSTRSRISTHAGHDLHSHTGSEAYPSDTDVRIAGGTAGLWPDVRYVLVSLMDMDNPVVRIFEITDGTITEEPLEAL